MPQLSLGARLSAAIVGASLVESAVDSGHVAELQEEAELMNEAFRELEEKKMGQTINALKHAQVILEEAVKEAAQVTMSKEALGVPGWGAVGALRKSFGGAAQAAGRLMPRLSTKQKLIGGAALAGTGYAGYKGLQAARDYMTTPSQHGTYGKGPAIMHNVNEFGYPEY